ncbi:MAG: hypothetical protein Pg6A_16970 [Termitinemataceae bacterium]|nr:MAG: hypothetical protein Pg6A_16970 [Termitinemataceae bacterium]
MIIIKLIRFAINNPPSGRINHSGTYALDSKWWQGSDEKAEGYTYKETPYGLIITGYQGDSTRLTIPDTLNGKPVKYIYRIGKAISGVRIPGGVIVIGNNAFSQDRLTTVSIGEGVTTIGDNAFAHNQLSSVTIPDSVTSIGKDAFAYNQLTSVTIGRGVVSFEAGVFASNEKLKNVTLPANVSLDDYTFGYYSGSYFKEAYEKNGKKAGTYTRVKYKWAYAEE